MALWIYAPGLTLLWIRNKKGFYLRGMNDTTTGTQLKPLGKKTPEEIMELAERISPLQTSTELKREAEISVAGNRAYAVSTGKKRINHRNFSTKLFCSFK